MLTLWQWGPLETDPIVDIRERHWNEWKWDHECFKCLVTECGDFKTTCKRHAVFEITVMSVAMLIGASLQSDILI